MVPHHCRDLLQMLSQPPKEEVNIAEWTDDEPDEVGVSPSVKRKRPGSPHRLMRNLAMSLTYGEKDLGHRSRTKPLRSWRTPPN